MKFDLISIFPDYFAPLNLSLIGKAQNQSLLQINVHDLRDHATDNHKTVDDTPYGGGAGMVMMPEIWGQAIDPLITTDSELIILSPAGQKFTQRMAEELSTKKHLIFACGRYEGIDDRVRQYYENQGFKVRLVSIGDYVLNGGEVAAMVMVESISRLLPGVLGNPDSLVEESHSIEGVLEYPTFTKPQNWRGLAVPSVLLSGNHKEIADWRASEARRISTCE